MKVFITTDCKCSEYKRKETLQKNYGCEYPIQNKKIFKKMKQTISEKKIHSTLWYDFGKAFKYHYKKWNRIFYL